MNGLPGNPSTDANGYYSGIVDYNWSGTVTPTKTDYTFTPTSTSYSNVTVNQSTNYTGTGPTSVEQLSTLLPTAYSVEQNYPNPFNPTTKIKYDIPKETFVSLRVYDLFGQEIEILVNERLPAGRYESEFNGSKLASGIYFYRLQAGSFTKTKKLILLK
ncbi:MAG: hypothetical protein A2V66_13800 [Ignavibacteria bacterium RBG_13_36_8]|nr:MAG: hypothetical protein A2V66_13800 [Ignavibacteria bacterium RBG_13_36_8]